jgi:hypothetical protein
MLLQRRCQAAVHFFVGQLLTYEIDEEASLYITFVALAAGESVPAAVPNAAMIAIMAGDDARIARGLGRQSVGEPRKRVDHDITTVSLHC